MYWSLTFGDRITNKSGRRLRTPARRMRDWDFEFDFDWKVFFCFFFCFFFVFFFVFFLFFFVFFFCFFLFFFCFFLFFFVFFCFFVFIFIFIFVFVLVVLFCCLYFIFVDFFLGGGLRKRREENFELKGNLKDERATLQIQYFEKEKFGDDLAGEVLFSLYLFFLSFLLFSFFFFLTSLLFTQVTLAVKELVEGAEEGPVEKNISLHLFKKQKLKEKRAKKLEKRELVLTAIVV